MSSASAAGSVLIDRKPSPTRLMAGVADNNNHHHLNNNNNADHHQHHHHQKVDHQMRHRMGRMYRNIWDELATKISIEEIARCAIIALLNDKMDYDDAYKAIINAKRQMFFDELSSPTSASTPPVSNHSVGGGSIGSDTPPETPVVNRFLNLQFCHYMDDQRLSSHHAAAAAAAAAAAGLSPSSIASRLNNIHHSNSHSQHHHHNSGSAYRSAATSAAAHYMSSPTAAAAAAAAAAVYLRPECSAALSWAHNIPLSSAAAAAAAAANQNNNNEALSLVTRRSTASGGGGGNGSTGGGTGSAFSRASIRSMSQSRSVSPVEP